MATNKKLAFSGQYSYDKYTDEVILSLFSFVDDNVHIIYSPAFDLSGYGNTEEEAKHSFEISLEEFMRYTNNKGTFYDELKRLGWEVKKKKSFKAPKLNTLLDSNDYLANIFDTKEFKKYNHQVAIPA